MPTPTTGDFYPQNVADSSGVATVEVTSSTSPNGAPEGTVHVTIDNPGEVGSGGAKLGTPGSGTTTGTGTAIGSGACLSVLLYNTDATDSLLFGNSVDQVISLAAGATASIPATNVNQIYVKDGSGAATFAYLPVIAA